ncbi:E3 ubiquitin-protein ligase RING1-like [Eutrema salsugineum]|uniref:E3 ubiquitin-protein ligase RING1-like n=1 Tax=Eutrema salsugineum TaxID=72664 RepID=UPI000CED76B4|nr:E3 ubiquitin-protein ligase RING1-like [Eutrema salsugineum]
MDDSQSSSLYNYLFGEADEITKRIEEYRTQHGRNDDSPPLVSPEHLSENICPTISYCQHQNRPTMFIPFNSISAEHHSSQHFCHMIYHHQLQNQSPRNWSRPIDIIRRIEEPERETGVGLTEREFSQLPTIKFQHSIEDKKCMICLSDYTRGEKLTILPCTHKYHEDCIRPWLKKSKLCCVCQREVVVGYK